MQLRILRRRPVYALLSVLTLALGIGGTAAVFGVANGVLLSPLPYAHERELGVFWMKTDWTHEEYLHIRGRTPGFRQVALYRQRDAMLRVGGGSARLVPGVAASSELLDVLGAAPCSDVDSGRAMTSPAPRGWPCSVLACGRSWAAIRPSSAHT